MNAKTPVRESLATGFRNVDTSGDTDACSRCLDLIAGIPFFNEIKRDSIRIIADVGPTRVLDAGCGAGVDLVTLASCLPDRCGIVGLDASSSLLARARERTAGIRGRCSLVKGDILNTPFRDRTFNACRIDRVLQHIHEPERAIGDLARTLAPGGTLVAFDNDWDTFSISLDDQEIADRIRRSWCDSFASGRVGKDLPRMFSTCGLAGIQCEQRTLVLRDLPLAEQVFDLPHLIGRLGRAGILSEKEIALVRDELAGKARLGTFTSGYTGYLVSGIRPE